MKPYLHTICVAVIFILFSAKTQQLNAQTIAITETNPTELLCAGQPITVSFNITGTFGSGNTFQIQLSSKSGSFTTPTIIGTLSWSGTTLSQILSANSTIPSITPVGTGYRIRIVSTATGIIGINTFKQFIISNRCGCNNDLLEKDWELSLGGSGSDQLIKIINTKDDGYLLAGTSSSLASGNKTVSSNGLNDFYVAKIDSNKNIAWQFSYGGTGNEELKSAIQTADGGYLLVGISNSGIGGNKTAPNYGGYDIWVVKLSSTGFKSWDRTFGGSLSDYAYDVKTTEDGNYLIAGSSTSLPDANKTSVSYGGADFWILKITTSGLKIWENTYGGSQDDVALRVVTRQNGNIILGGFSRSASSTGIKTSTHYGLADYWLVEINSNGTIIAQYAFGGTEDDIFQDMILTTDNNIILTGTSESSISGNKTTVNYGAKDMWIIKTNLSSIVWQKAYGTSSTDPSMCIKEGNDGSYLISGSSEGISGNKTSAAFGGSDMWIIGLESNGTEIMQQSFGGIGAEQANAMAYTTDGGFIIAGFSQSLPSGNKTTTNYGAEDFWIIKLKVLPMKYTLTKTLICKLSVDTAKLKINCNNLSSNTVQVQLSNAFGSFASPTIIGSGITNASNLNVLYTIPNTVSPGIYKIRVVVTTIPVYVADTINNIIISESPNFSGLSEFCNIGKNYEALGLLPIVTKQWQLNGTNISGENNSFIFPNTFGTYTLKASLGTCVINSDAQNIVPANSNSLSTLVFPNGAERFLCDNSNGEVIAKIKDNVGGNTLGAIAANLFIDPTLQTALGQPYARRHWDITPFSPGPAKVTIYIQQSDFTHYNANTPINFAKMPVNSADTNGIKNLIVMQCHGTSITKLPGTYSGSTEFFDKTKFNLIWNVGINMWELSFDATDFSGIFLITMPLSTLPVELTSFTGKFIEEKNANELKWTTASEINNKNFEIERMDINNQFINIGEVAGNGNSNTINNYVFEDIDFNDGDNYYRLKQNDYDGKVNYSNIIFIKSKKIVQNNNNIKAWLSQQTLNISSQQPINAEIYSINGKVEMILNNANTTYNVDITQLSKGIYIVHTTDLFGNKKVFKIIK